MAKKIYIKDIVQKTSVKSPSMLANLLSKLKPNQRVIGLSASTEIGATSEAKEDASSTPAGVSGTALWGDVFNEEYLPELKGYAGSRQYDKMMRQDYQVGFVENAIMSIIKSADYQFTIPDVKNGDLHAEACEWQRTKGTNKVWGENLNDLGSYKFFGFAVFEPMKWSIIDHWKFGVLKKLDVLGFRDQKTITGWQVDDYENIEWIKQQQQYGNNAGTYIMPGQNVIVLSEKRRGGNLEGISLLRTAYGPYWRKNIYLKLMGIGLEKAALGMIIVTVPPNKAGKKEETNFLEGVKNYITHENSYLKKTGGKDYEGFKVDVIAVDFKADAVLTAIKHEDLAISKCGLAMFSELGQSGSGGSYSLGVGELDFFFTSIIESVDYICEKTQRIWDTFVIKNWGEQNEYPQLKGIINNMSGEIFARILNYYYNIGVYHPQIEDEISFRKKWKMQPLTPEMEDKIRKQASKPDVIPPTIPDDTDPDNPEDEEPEDDDLSTHKLTRQPASYVRKISGGIPFKKFIKEKEALTDSYNKGVTSALTAVKDKYIIDIANALRKNPNNQLKAISNVKLGFTRQLYNTLESHLVDSFGWGKKQGNEILAIKKKKVKLTSLANIDELLPKSRRWIKGTAGIAFTIMTNTMEEEALSAASNAINKGFVINEIVFETGNAMEDWINNKNNLGSGILVPEGLNGGQEEAYAVSDIEQTGKIYRNFDPVTEICKWLDNRSVKIGDPNAVTFHPPNHWGCDSFAIPIMSDEAQPAVWDGWNVPPSVVAAQDTLNIKMPAHILKLSKILAGGTTC